MAAVNLNTLDKHKLKEFFESFDIVLSDCDGVLWTESEVIHGSPETVSLFKQIGKVFFYITNNNTNTRLQLVDKCKNLGYTAVTDEIICSSYLAANYLKDKNFKKKVYVVGSEGISSELEAQGIQNFGVGPDIMVGTDIDLNKRFKPDSEVGAVVVGFDKHFSYPKMVKAATYVQNPDVYFIGTNPDRERPSPFKTRFPGAGCLLLSIEAAAGKKAIVLGKPELYVSDMIKKKYNVNPSRTLMIGDNLNTDILLGKRSGFTTLLVMTGITSEKDLENFKSSKSVNLPDFWAPKLSDVIACYKTLCD